MRGFLQTTVKNGIIMKSKSELGKRHHRHSLVYVEMQTNDNKTFFKYLLIFLTSLLYTPSISQMYMNDT